VRDIQAGEIFTGENIRTIRPGYGLPPKQLNMVLGRQAKRLLCKGMALNWDMVQ
jgi:sialic acid synthase SpsE